MLNNATTIPNLSEHDARIGDVLFSPFDHLSHVTEVVDIVGEKFVLRSLQDSRIIGPTHLCEYYGVFDGAQCCRFPGIILSYQYFSLF